MFKSKKPTIDFELPLPKVTGPHRRLYDILTGEAKDDVMYHASGVLLDDSIALLQGPYDRHFVVALRYGGELYKMTELHRSMPQARAIEPHLTVFAESPAERHRAEEAMKRAQMTQDERTKAEVEELRKLGFNATIYNPTGSTASQKQDIKNYPPASIL